MSNIRVKFNNFSNIRRKFKFISLGLILFVIIILLYTLCTQIFKIRTIELVGEGIKLNVDDKKMSKNIILLSTEELKKNILAQHPEIQYLNITKKLPNILIIGISTRNPAAHLILSNKSNLIDSEGKIINYTLPLNQILPNINIVGYDSINQVDSKIIKKGLDLLTNLSNFEKVINLTIDKSGYYRINIIKVDILIPQDAEILATESTLQTLLTRFRMKGTLPSQIDLRFDKPVIRY
jgi:hypothetical protein